MAIPIGRERRDLLQGSACVVMEAKKSHNLQSAGLRPREADGGIQSDSRGPRNKGPVVRAGYAVTARVPKCWCLRAADGVSALVGGWSPLSSASCSFSPQWSAGGAPLGEDSLFYSVATSSRGTLRGTLASSVLLAVCLRARHAFRLT